MYLKCVHTNECELVCLWINEWMRREEKKIEKKKILIKMANFFNSFRDSPAFTWSNLTLMQSSLAISLCRNQINNY
jgi:hypothetical protein